MTGNPPLGEPSKPDPEASACSDPEQTLLLGGAVDPPMRPGQIASLDRYELLHRVGVGGMGIVYCARDSGTGARVAVKVMRPDRIAQAGMAGRFLREARLTQALSHPSILPLLEVCDRATGPYFVTPLIEPGSLAERVRAEGPLNGAEAGEAARQVAEALDYCHRRGVIHRDVKLANVLLERGGRAYLCDLGLGRPLSDVSVAYVQQDKRVGTAPYMATEIVNGHAGDFRCDIYSFGATLYEILTGHQPYKGEKVEDVFARIKDGPPAPILSVNPAADPRLARVAEGAMARELRDRYATMQDVLADLERARDGRPPLGPRGSAHPKPRWTRRAALAGVGLCIVALLAFGALPRRGGARPNPPAPRSAVLIEDLFEGGALDEEAWAWGETSEFSYQGMGDCSFDVAQRDGSLLIEARANHTDGWMGSQLVWVDSKADLREAEGDIRLEIEFAGDAARGNLMVAASEGAPPASRRDPASVRLFEASGSPARLAVERRVLDVDISRSSGVALVRERGQPPEEFWTADLSGLSSWRLRLCVAAASTARFPPDEVRLRVFRVRARAVEPSTGIVGQVLDAQTNRPVAGAVARLEGREAETNSRGLFTLPAPPGLAVLTAKAEDYRQVGEGATARVEPEGLARATIRMRRARIRHGDAFWATPSDVDQVYGIAKTDGWLYFVASDSGARSLFRMRGNGLERARIAPIEIRNGLAFADEALLGANSWPARLYRIGEDGRTTTMARLRFDWIRGIAYDGERLWLLESSRPDNRYAAYAIDLATGELATTFAFRDRQIAGIAAEPVQAGGRVWVSSLAGTVYEIDPAKAGKTGKAEDGVVRQFAGWYDHLSFHRGELWGADNGAERFCILNLDGDALRRAAGP